MDINELLRSVNSLLSKIVLLDLWKRTKAYKQHGSSDIQQDIATPLFDCIDKLAAQASAPIVAQASDNAQPAAEKTQDPAQPTRPQAADMLSSNISEDLKPHLIHSDSANHLGEKLKANAWSHFHTSILRAREGDARTAKLHANIANQALKEAGHYMSDEDFKIFSEEFAQALNELKQQSS